MFVTKYIFSNWCLKFFPHLLIVNWLQTSSVFSAIMVGCAAVGCRSRSTKKIAGISFHRFPADPAKRNVWVQAIQRENWTPLKSTCLCSLHFEEKFIDRTSVNCVRLRENARPTIFPSFSKCLVKVALERKPPSVRKLFAKEISPLHVTAEIKGVIDLPTTPVNSTAKSSTCDLPSPLKHRIRRSETTCTVQKRKFRTLQQAKLHYKTDISNLKRSPSTGMDFKFKMDEEVNYEVTSGEVLLPAIVDSTPDVPHINKIKTEFSFSEPHSYGDFLERAIVKHEDRSIELLDFQIKSEVPDLNCDTNSDIDNIDIKLEQVVSEEVLIKTEVEESLVDQTIKESTQVKQFYCGLCDSKFAYKKNLQRHLNNHAKAKLFQCNMCQYKCIKKSKLEEHMKIHIGEKPFKCSVCDYRCIRKHNFKRHMQIHNGEKPFQCNICNSKFRHKLTMQQHMTIHTGERPLQCNICDYKCTRRNHLQLHMKTHTGEKPLKCSVCDYRCIQRSNLQQHLKTHTGEKPLKCNICNYRCRRMSHLQRHMKIHT